MPAAIEIKNVSVRLGTFQALTDINVDIEAGEFVGIIGPNGAGKSTLLRAILGLVPLESGEIKILGKPHKKISPELIGNLPQLKTVDRNFPAVTCDLIASGMKRSWPGILTKKDHKRIEEVLDMVGATHLCHKPLGQLSGGELQRVYMARVMARKPKILLLDEPATGIDAVGEDYLYRILDQYMEKTNATVMMVTHDWLVGRHHASKVLLLNQRVISYGTPEESLSDEHLREAFGHIGHTHSLNQEHSHHD